MKKRENEGFNLLENQVQQNHDIQSGVPASWTILVKNQIHFHHFRIWLLALSIKKLYFPSAFI